jgi:hypothetical protein
MKNFLTFTLLITAALIAIGSPIAHAATLLQEDFESYADDAAIFGTTVGADGGRTGGPWTNGNKEAGSVDGIHLNTNGVNVPLTFGQNLKRVPANTGTAADGIGQGRTGHDFTPTLATATTPLSIKWKFFDDGNHTTTVTQLGAATSKVPLSVLDLKNSDDKAVIQIGLTPILSQFGPASDVNTFQASITTPAGGNAGSVAFNLAALRPTTPGWTTFELVTTGGFASLYVNGSATPDANFNNIVITPPASSPGGAFNYDRIRLGSGSTIEGALPGYTPAVWTGYDDVLVQSIPEPTAGLLALWGAGLMLVGRRKTRN